MKERLLVVLLYKDDVIIGFKISGHANYDEHGKDIVCAGVSVLAQTTIASIDHLTKDDFDKVIIEPGNTYILINPKKITEDAKLLLKSFKIGIEGICHSYKEYITISEQEVNLNDKRF